MSANPLHIISAVIIVVLAGVTMAATGFSRDTFMGLVLIGAGIVLIVPNLKNVQNPPPGYTRANYLIMFGVAVALIIAGALVLIYGIPESK